MELKAHQCHFSAEPTLDQNLRCFFRHRPEGTRRQYALQVWRGRYVARATLDKWVLEQVAAGRMTRQKRGREVLLLWIGPMSD
jgi:hypothetical protein